MEAIDSRTFYLNNNLGRRQLRETLGSLLIGLTLSTDDIWIVSPWISDFDLIDNRTGNWNSIQPEWSNRMIRLSEVLGELLNSGSKIKIVTNGDLSNRAFLTRLTEVALNKGHYKSAISSDLHVKGLLTSNFFLSGSMNFTYSGTTINEEQVQISSNPNLIVETRLEFEKRYLDTLV